MKYEQIKYIHEYLVRFFNESEDPISPPGIKNEETLRSAIARPFMSVGGNDAYKGIFPKAAAMKICLSLQEWLRHMSYVKIEMMN